MIRPSVSSRTVSDAPCWKTCWNSATSLPAISQRLRSVMSRATHRNPSMPATARQSDPINSTHCHPSCPFRMRNSIGLPTLLPSIVVSDDATIATSSGWTNSSAKSPSESSSRSSCRRQAAFAKTTFASVSRRNTMSGSASRSAASSKRAIPPPLSTTMTLLVPCSDVIGNEGGALDRSGPRSARLCAATPAPRPATDPTNLRASGWRRPRH